MGPALGYDADEAARPAANTLRPLRLAAERLDGCQRREHGVPAYRSRSEDLVTTAARIKFLSLEPLLGPLPDLDLTGTDWVIVGGESGPGARPMRPEWAIDIPDQCLAAGLPLFLEQWGGVNKKRAGRLIEGRTWDEIPGDAHA